jgi:hypothetical protein
VKIRFLCAPLAALLLSCSIPFDAPIDQFFDSQTGSITLAVVPTDTLRTGTDGVLCVEPGTGEISIPLANEQGYGLVLKSAAVTGAADVEVVLDGGVLKIIVNGTTAAGDEFTVHVVIANSEGRIVYEGDIVIACTIFDAALESLALDGAVLNPAFDSGKSAYAAVYTSSLPFLLDAEAKNSAASITLSHLNPAGTVIRTEKFTGSIDDASITIIEDSTVRLRVTTPHEISSSEYTVLVTDSAAIEVSGSCVLTLNDDLAADNVFIKAYADSDCSSAISGAVSEADGENYALNIPFLYFGETIYLRIEAELSNGAAPKSLPAALSLGSMDNTKNLADTVSPIVPYSGPGGTVTPAQNAAFAGTRQTVTATPASGYTVSSVSCNGGSFSDSEFTMPNVRAELSAVFESTKDITGFEFDTINGETTVITGTNITVTVPWGAGVTSLTPTVTHTGTGYSPTGPQDFSSPRPYTVTGADGAKKIYTVTVNFTASPENDITGFEFNSVSGDTTVIIGTLITVTVPYGTNVTNLTPTVTCSAGADYSPKGAQNFSSPKTYTVTAANGSPKNWTVAVEIAPNPAKDITSFLFNFPESTFTITGTDISVKVPWGTDLTDLTPTVTCSAGAHYSPTGAQDFSSPKTYTVTAEDTTTKNYTVTVSHIPGTIAQWARSKGIYSHNTYLKSVAVDSSGGVYGAGYRGLNASFDFRLIKYDSGGTEQTQWDKTVPGGVFYAVKTDPSGNVYAAGYGDPGTINFGNGKTVTVAVPSGIVAKFDPSGTAQWVTAEPYANFQSAVLDSSGNVIAAGGHDEAFLAAYSAANGSKLWEKTVSGDFSAFYSVAIDSSGNILAAGEQNGTGSYDFGNGKSAAASGDSGARHSMIAKYDSAGNAQWAKTVVTGDGNSRFASIAVDSSGSVYAAGTVGSGSYNYGNNVSVGPDMYARTVLVKYNSSGTPQWIKIMSNSVAFNAVAVDASAVYVAGYIQYTNIYDFGNDIKAKGSATLNIVLIKYDFNGVTQWAKTVSSGTANADFYGVTADNFGNVIAVGRQQGRTLNNYGSGVTVAGPGNEAANTLIIKYHE